MATAVWTLMQRELIRFIRQRNRVFSALGQPLIFWLFFGTGLRASFDPSGLIPGGEGLSYMAYFFPGVVVMILLFTAIFSTISIIEDRREGFLQGVLVAPLPAYTLVFGKLLGGTLLASLHAGLFLLLAPTQGFSLGVFEVLALLVAVPLVAFSLTGCGFILAWRMDSTQGFHAVMMLLLMPMWLLSGAFFPAEGTPPVLYWLIKLNPLTYGSELIRGILHGFSSEAAQHALALPLLITLGFATSIFVLSLRVIHKRTAGDLH